MNIAKCFDVDRSTAYEVKKVCGEAVAPASPRSCQRYVERHLESKGLWSKDTWPPLSCNLNPLDFSVWAHVEKHASATHHSNIDDLKHAVAESLDAMAQLDTVGCCASLRKHVRAVIPTEWECF